MWFTSIFSFSYNAFKRLPQDGLVKCYPLPHNLKFKSSREKECFENIMGNGEHSGYKHFLLLLQYFCPMNGLILFSEPPLSAVLTLYLDKSVFFFFQYFMSGTSFSLNIFICNYISQTD